MSTVLYAGYACSEPKQIYEDALRLGWPVHWTALLNQFTDDAPGVDSGQGTALLANSWSNPRGTQSGQGWIILPFVSLDAIGLDGEYDLTFSLAPGEVAGLVLTKPQTTTQSLLHVVSTVCITSGLRGDPKCAYLVELADRRQLARGAVIDAAYNVLSTPGTQDYFTATLDGDSDAWTWDEMVGDVWSKLAVWLGAYPGLPFTPDGVPQGFNFYGNGCAIDALGFILDRIGCALVMNAAAAFSIVQVGAPDKAATAALLKNDKIRVWDEDPLLPSSLPATILVQFPAQHATPDDTGSSPWYTVSVGGGGVSGTVVVNDDLAAVYDATNTLTNSTALDSRATAVATAYLLALAAGPVRRYYGLPLPDAGLQPGSLIQSVRWGDRGRGLITQVMNDPEPAPSPRPEVAAQAGGGETQYYVILAVFADYLECVLYAPPMGVPDYSSTRQSGGTPVVYIAKPYELQQTAWASQTATLNGLAVTFTFTGAGARTATDGSGNTESQVIVPDYVTGDIISAIAKTTGLTGGGNPIELEDTNEAGRAWAAVADVINEIVISSTLVSGGTDGYVLGVAGGVVNQFSAIGGFGY